MLESGAQLKTVGKILGHTDETMTMRYAHTNFAAQASAVASLGNKPKRVSDEEDAAKIPPGKNQKERK